jgi:opacity protein-like surface antigen
MLKTCLVGLASAVCLMAMPQVKAAEQGPYLNVDAGVNFVHDISIFGTEIEMDPGFRVGIAPGFNVNNFFGVQFETGFIYNEPEGGSDEWFGHVPLVAQAIFRYEFDAWTFFGGPGLGGTLSFIEADAGVDSDSDTTLAFAWQAQLGLRYNIGDNLAIGGVYKYLGVLDPEFELFGTEFEVENVHNHYIGVQLNMAF